MTVRWRILLFELIILAFVGLMVAVILFGLRLTDEFVTRIDGVHRRFEVIAELEAHADNYAEQIAEVLLLGSEQKPDFDAARAEMDAAFERLAEVTRAEVSTLDGLDEVQRELSDIEGASRLTELYNAIDRAAQRVFALQADRQQEQAVDIFRRDVEYWLSNDFEALIEAALQDERNEVAAERAEVRAQQELAFLGAGALSLIALGASAFLGVSLHRSIAKPMRALSAGADAIAAGRFDHRIPEEGRDEFAAVSRSFNAMARAVEEQRADLVSAQARLETEVASRTRELQAANERLRDLDERRVQFLADVSHELRTPLTILRGEADFALRGSPQPAQYRESLARIQGQAIEMGRLLDDLIAFARSDADDHGFEPETVPAAELVAAAVQEGSVLSEPRDIHIETRLADDGALVRADPRRLRQALLIGIDNAVKYAPPGSRIMIETERKDGAVTIAISDEGEGIAEADRPHVFDRFYRGGAGGRRGGDGLGIGLAIAKSIVERHRGVVSLDNGPRRGAVLRIALPPRDGSRVMKILVVEDDRRILTFLKRALEAEGHHVTVAEDGRDGLERVRGEPFDLMILDRMLPYLDGLEVCRIVRQERHPVTILMLTAKDSIQDKVEGLRGGADDYLTKPFALDELLARIVALQRRRSGGDETESLRVGPLMLDPASHRVTVDGREITLTLREFELLRYFIANPDRVISRQRLLDSVWEYSFEPGTKVVDVYIRYLRKKIGDEDGALLQTVRGIGYMLKRPGAAPA